MRYPASLKTSHPQPVPNPKRNRKTRNTSVVDKVDFVLLFSVRDEVLAELDFPFVVRVFVINEPLVFCCQIGGVMIMGDRGTGKTTTIRGAGG